MDSKEPSSPRDVPEEPSPPRDVPEEPSPPRDVPGDVTLKFQEAFDDSAAFGRKAKEVKIDEEQNKKQSISSEESGGYFPQIEDEELNGADNEKKPASRGEWGNHLEFFLTSVGLAVGLGNIWRFPYVCYENGGGTFLIPYLFSLLFLGIPLFFLEMVLGQYAGTSATVVFRRLAPGLKGLGYGMVAVNVIINFYYTIIMAWAFIYMFEGWRSELPWKRCDPEIGTKNCFYKSDADNCNDTTTFWNFTCTSNKEFCSYYDYDVANDACVNTTSGEEIGFSNVTNRVTPSEEYFYRYVLGITGLGTDNTWENYGEPQWKIIGALALSWTIIGLGLIRGISSYGKLSYFITVFPYVVLTTFLIYVSQQEGFSDGVKFFITPQWDKLLESSVWLAAIIQIFYSLGVAIGCQLLLNSYNDFNANCHRDAWLIALCNSFTSIFAGFIVFGTLGMLAHNLGLEVKDVVSQGTGLAFQAYPAAVTIMSPSQLFSFMFFFMVCLLAMSTISAAWEPVVAAIFDDFPNLRNHKSKVYLSCCLVGFICGISCCFQSGYFMFNLLNDRISNSIVYLAFLEVITVAWFYGVNRFMDNIDEMKIWMPQPFRGFFIFCWAFLNPLMLFIVIITLFLDRVPSGTEGYEFPDGIQVLGWLIELFPLAIPLVLGLVSVIKKFMGEDPGEAAFLRSGPLLTPSSQWGPRDDRPKPALSGISNLGMYDDIQVEKRTEL